MSRYINTDKILYKDLSDGRGLCWVVFKDWIDKMPTADVRENVRGEWIEDKKAEQEHQLIFHKVWTCSQCGERQCRLKGSNFCPNCGADMRGG